MERQLLEILYPLIWSQWESGEDRGTLYRDALIVLTYLWSVINDRPICWACHTSNWSGRFAGYEPPSPGTMSRRLRRRSVLKLLVRVLFLLQAAWPREPLHWVDGKPLAVGGASHDRDARAGYGAGMMAKGYRIHAVYNAGGAIEALAVTPMDQSEARVARELMTIFHGQGYLVGDNHYDANYLYDDAAMAGLQLVTSPPRRKKPKGTGHRKQSPHRLRGLAIRKTPWGASLIRGRFGIDRIFGHQGNIPHGLNPLPNFVRHRFRVALWTVGKLIVYALYCNQKSALTT